MIMKVELQVVSVKLRQSRHTLRWASFSPLDSVPSLLRPLLRRVFQDTSVGSTRPTILHAKKSVDGIQQINEEKYDTFVRNKDTLSEAVLYPSAPTAMKFKIQAYDTWRPNKSKIETGPQMNMNEVRWSSIP